MGVKRAARAVKSYLCAMSTMKEGDGPYEPENRDSEGRTLFGSFWGRYKHDSLPTALATPGMGEVEMTCSMWEVCQDYPPKVDNILR